MSNCRKMTSLIKWLIRHPKLKITSNLMSCDRQSRFKTNSIWVGGFQRHFRGRWGRGEGWHVEIVFASAPTHGNESESFPADPQLRRESISGTESESVSLLSGALVPLKCNCNLCICSAKSTHFKYNTDYSTISTTR